MKRTGQPFATPIWIKRFFMVIAIVVSLLGIVVIPTVSHFLVKGIFDMMASDSDVGSIFGFLAGLIVFIGYLIMVFYTDLFGLAHQKNWK